MYNTQIGTLLRITEFEEFSLILILKIVCFHEKVVITAVGLFAANPCEDFVSLECMQ
jgi:hypothetical protein